MQIIEAITFAIDYWNSISYFTKLLVGVPLFFTIAAVLGLE
jgi:hypothetical protein